VYARPHGNWLPIAALVALMADLGVDAQAVRSSITRRKRRGVLRSERRVSAAGTAPCERVRRASEASRTVRTAPASTHRIATG
jgi:DNA-binding transcriptional regulator PaaX